MNRDIDRYWSIEQQRWVYPAEVDDALNAALRERLDLLAWPRPLLGQSARSRSDRQEKRDG